MKLFTVMLKSLVLALVLTLSAKATDKVDINTASAAELDQVMVNVGALKGAGNHRSSTGKRPLQECRGTGAGEGNRAEDGRTESRPDRGEGWSCPRRQQEAGRNTGSQTDRKALTRT